MENRVCKRCVMDKTDPNIKFDNNGYCNHCRQALSTLSKYPFSLSAKEKELELKKLVAKIKKKGKKKKYDCIIGISGGVDSTYLCYYIKKLGLRPLAVHLDNGWNTELSVKNIQSVLDSLGIDLYTHVLKWDEFKDLQLSFLKAGVPDLEIPTDHAIFILLYDIASKYNIKYILTGNNIATESILPSTWSNGHTDWKYIKYIHKKFGTKKLTNFPFFSFGKIIKYNFIQRIKMIGLLNFIEYTKEDALRTLEQKINYKRYDSKHYESVYTRFIQGYILPKRFNFDKRKAHLSSLICSGQITREDALFELRKDPYPNPELLKEDYEYVLKKFNLTTEEFEELMDLPIKYYTDFPNMNGKFWVFAKRIFMKLFVNFFSTRAVEN